MLKTCLNNFGNVFRHFEKLIVFPVFWSFSKCRPYRVHWALFSEKIAWKQVQNLCGDFQDCFWTLLRIQFFFRLFLPSFTNFDLQVALGKKNSKKLPQASSDTFDNVFRDFEFLKSFRFLCIFLSLQGSLGRAFLRRNNQAKHAQTMFLGTFLEKFESFAVFPLFLFFLRVSTTQGALGKNFCQKKYLEACWKHVWLLLGTFFQAFWTIESFSSFLKFFQVSTLQGKLVIFFNQKNYLGACWKLVWTLLGKILVILKKKFFNFSKVFPSFDPPGCSGHYFFEKNLKTSSKLVWILLETCLGILNFGKFLHFFEIFRLLYPPGCTDQKISKKSHQNMFGQSWKRFWTFLKIWILFHFCGTFLSLQGALGREFFRRNNQAKHAQTMFLGTFLENFESFEVFSIFLCFLQVSTTQGALGKIFCRKITSKHVENMFEHFWERF